MLKTHTQARDELRRKGVSITRWALAHGFSPGLVFEVLSGRRKCTSGQSHAIAITLGLKAGEIVTDPKQALT
ncbi:MAG: DNA-binding protein [Burkholderiaceae bacterium]|jgi:gp16 family phage-associated protein|nr:DNA-binding protein [Burkholderiaceae bacterium]